MSSKTKSASGRTAAAPARARRSRKGPVADAGAAARTHRREILADRSTERWRPDRVLADMDRPKAETMA